MNFNFYMMLFLVVLLLTGISCSPEDNNPVDPGINPLVSKVKLNQKWNNLNDKPYQIEVWVADPQGVRNIKSVRIQIEQDQNQEIVLEDSLFDDGGYSNPDNGDVLAGDGVFTNRYLAADLSMGLEEVSFTINIMVSDKDQNQSQLFTYPLIVGANHSPRIQRIDVPDSLSANNPDLTFSITISDSDGISDVVEAYFESGNLAKGYTKFEQYLYNDGDMENHGDHFSGDSIFTAKITTEFTGGKLGEYEIRFYVKDSYGEQNSMIPIHMVYVGNLPPQIEMISMPDTMHIPSGTGDSDYNYKPISVQVSDPEGLSSIDSVYFYSLKPEDELANEGRPFVMVDNGQAFNINDWFRYENYGDETANDGKYAYPLVVRNDFDPGVYIFMFYVRDKAGNLTGPVNKTIELISTSDQGE